MLCYVCCMSCGSVYEEAAYVGAACFKLGVMVRMVHLIPSFLVGGLLKGRLLASLLARYCFLG